MPDFMFDSEIFGEIVNKNLDDITKSVDKNKYFVTQAQYDTVKNTEYSGLFAVLERVPEESYGHILSLLDDKEKKPANAQDALIIEACINNKYTFGTGNTVFGEIAWKYGARVNNLYEFLKAVK